MSDNTEAKIIVTTSAGEEIEMAPSDLTDFLQRGIQLQSMTSSIKVSRSIPRDKFEKNEYFHSVSANLEGAYALAGNSPEETVRKALGAAIITRARKAFDLSRVMLREQQEADGLTVVSLAEVTKV